MAASGQKETILVVDDAPGTLEVIRRNLTSQGYQVLTAANVKDAISILEATEIDLVITDIKMPELSGFDLIRHIQENFKNAEVMVITGYPTIEGAVDAVKHGAEEYLSKPFTDEELYSAVDRVIKKLHERRAVQNESTHFLKKSHGLMGESKAMQKVFTAIAKAASTMATVLISGESGTGKELVARAIHYNSPRAAAPFVPINCGGIPDNLLESELFGYVKGAFTGATESRAGFFQTADGGTIFLDEIGDTSITMQTKLLRVLQDKEIYMVGSRRPQSVAVRIMAATNKDLHSLMQQNLFREDLFFRLNVINIEVPPLRDKEDDILLLTHHFADKFAKEADRIPPRFTDKTLNVLRHYYWPGNVRELENVIQRLVVMTDDEVIDIPDLPSYMRFSAVRQSGLRRTLAEMETEYIINVLASVNGNKSRAAEILGIDRKTLREKIKRYEMNS